VGERVEDASSHLLRRLDCEGEADDLLGTRARFDPPRYLIPGDVIEVEASGIGTLRNGVVDEA